MVGETKQLKVEDQETDPEYYGAASEVCFSVHLSSNSFCLQQEICFNFVFVTSGTSFKKGNKWRRAQFKAKVCLKPVVKKYCSLNHVEKIGSTISKSSPINVKVVN